MADARSLSPSSSAPDRRWPALYVLCVGMLMIILDGTIVNVALPSIQTDLGFSGSSLAWVVNAYLIPFGGLLLLAGRLGDLVGSQTHPDHGSLRVHRGLIAVRPLNQSASVDRCPIHTGCRRRHGICPHPGHDRSDVPRASRAGQGDRGL